MDVVQGVTPAQQFIKIMNEELTEVLGSKQSPLARKEEGLTTILMAGLQGTGKSPVTPKCLGHSKTGVYIFVSEPHIETSGHSV